MHTGWKSKGGGVVEVFAKIPGGRGQGFQEKLPGRPPHPPGGGRVVEGIKVLFFW
jgi:hypothetical protein